MNRQRWAVALTCATVLAGVVVSGPVAGAAAPTPADTQRSTRDLARITLRTEVRGADDAATEAAVARAGTTAAQRAAASPDTVGSAGVVFADGLTTDAAATLVASRNLEVAQAEAKVAANGEVYTLWLLDFGRVPGTAKQSLERAVGKARLHYFREAAAGQPALRAVATGDIRLYKLDVVGTNAQLASLTREKSVAAVLPDADTTKVTGLRATQARAPVAASGEVRLASGDPARGTTGPPTVAGTNQPCEWVPGGGALSCGTTPPTTASAKSAGGASAGGTTKPRGEGPISVALDDISIYTQCNSPADSQNCPNDNTYRPHPSTGGAQDFGVSIASYPAGTYYFYDCYAVFVYDPYASPDGPGGYWTTICTAYVYTTPAFTYGVASWFSRWGTLMASVPSQGASRFVATAAFKPQGTLPACDVDQFFATAQCDKSDSNAVEVPFPGIEDELNIGNPGCTATRRGDPSDQQRGCFYPSFVGTTFPPESGPMLDTTFGDGPANYNLAILATVPGRILEGVTYNHYAEFYASGTNNMIGQMASHAVSVDSDVTASLACLGNFGSPPFCFFPVDSSRVSPIIPFA